MTALELKEAFLQQYDAITNFAAPGYEDSEISAFLTDAQLALVKKLILTGDRTELEKKVLSNLVTPYSTSTFYSDSNNFPNGVYVSLPLDVIAVWQEYVLYENANTPIKVKPVTYDRYIVDINNPYQNPSPELVWRLDTGGKHELITDGAHKVGKYNIRYVRMPLNIDITNGVTSELTIAFHDNVVSDAVQAAIQTITRNQGLKQPTQQPRSQENSQQD